VTTTAPLLDVLGLFARAGEVGRGQPDGHVDEVCWIGIHIAKELGLREAELCDVFFSTLLVHGGCTAGMPEFAAFIASDELSAQRDLCLCDADNMAEVFTCMKRNVAPEAPLPKRVMAMLRMMLSGDRMMENVSAGCADVGSRVAARLGLSDGAVDALGCVCETWNGRGPRKQSGTQIPLVSRIAQAALVAAVFHREGGPSQALNAVARRAGRSLDPEVARAFRASSADPAFFEMLGSSELGQALRHFASTKLSLAREVSVDVATLCLADLVDLKSKRTAAHSRSTAELAERLALELGADESEAALCHRAGLVHDLGLLGVPAFLLDQPAPKAAERARIELHPHLTEQLLGAVPALTEVTAIAAAHHERLDGSGYPRGVTASALPRAARILAVADEYDELVRGTEGRAPATRDEAMKALLAQAGTRLDAAVVRALGKVLNSSPREESIERPAGLTEREVEVLRLVAVGLTLKEIGRELALSQHTVRHHLEHVYEKIGTSNRAGATLFAVENGIVQ